VASVKFKGPKDHRLWSLLLLSSTKHEQSHCILGAKRHFHFGASPKLFSVTNKILLVKPFRTVQFWPRTVVSPSWSPCATKRQQCEVPGPHRPVPYASATDGWFAWLWLSDVYLWVMTVETYIFYVLWKVVKSMIYDAVWLASKTYVSELHNLYQIPITAGWGSSVHPPSLLQAHPSQTAGSLQAISVRTMDEHWSMTTGQWPWVNPTCLTCGEIHNWICAITACVLIESAHTLDLNFKYLEGIELLGCASLIWFLWVWSGIVSRKKKHLLVLKQPPTT
jgi:hypothetical protein